MDSPATPRLVRSSRRSSTRAPEEEDEDISFVFSANCGAKGGNSARSSWRLIPLPLTTGHAEEKKKTTRMGGKKAKAQQSFGYKNQGVRSFFFLRMSGGPREGCDGRSLKERRRIPTRGGHSFRKKRERGAYTAGPNQFRAGRERFWRDNSERTSERRAKPSTKPSSPTLILSIRPSRTSRRSPIRRRR